MIDDKSKLFLLEKKKCGRVTLRDNKKCDMLGSVTRGLKNSFSFKKSFAYRWFKAIFLSISQLCDNGFYVKFLNNKCILNLHNKPMLEGVRINYIYMINLETCIIVKTCVLKLFSINLGCGTRGYVMLVCTQLRKLLAQT